MEPWVFLRTSVKDNKDEYIKHDQVKSLDESDDEGLTKVKAVDQDHFGFLRMLIRIVLPSITILFIVGYVGMAVFIFNDFFDWPKCYIH